MAKIKGGLEKLIWDGHLFAGLLLLTGIWIFFLGGLLLNHPLWKISGFWNSRKHSTEMLSFSQLTQVDDTGRAAELVDQLGLSGEIEQVKSFPGGDSLSLTLVRPGAILNITAFPQKRVAKLESNRVNASGALQMLHTFSGVRIGEPARKRDWLLTRIWSVTMDAVSIGLLLVVAGGLYLAFRRQQAFGPKIIALGLGVAACCFFLFGPGWFF